MTKEFPSPMRLTLCSRLRRFSLIRISSFVLRDSPNFCIASRQFSRQFDYELPH
jgi:hypothetical protein